MFCNMTYSKMNRIEKLKGEKDDVTKTLKIAQEHTHVLPYCDTYYFLSSLIKEAWETLCQRNYLMKEEAKKKFCILKNNNKKGDAEKIILAEENLNQMIGK